MPDFYRDWRDKAKVDYFPQLIILWLSTNSWYKFFYSDLGSTKDCDYIDKLCDDNSPRNQMYVKFEKFLVKSNGKENIEIKKILAGLCFSLEQAELYWKEETSTEKICFENIFTKRISQPPLTYISIIERGSQGVGKIKIEDTLNLKDDVHLIFESCLRIIYKVRCLLVHGSLEPNKENHEVVKYCYFLLDMMMSF